MRPAYPCVGICFLATLLGAAPRVVPIPQRAIDRVSLQTGESLIGLAAGMTNDQRAILLVRRDWLLQHAPRHARTVLQNEQAGQKQIFQTTLDRIAAWKTARPDNVPLQSLLKSEHARLEKQQQWLEQGKLPPSPLVRLLIPVKQLKSKYLQTPARRRLAALAWQAEIANVEEASAAELTKALLAKKMDPEKAMPDLSDRLGLSPQDDQQWHAKMAVVEFSLTGQPHYQGTGGVLLKIAEGQPAGNLAGLIGQMTQDHLAATLDDLLAPNGTGAKADDQRIQTAVDRALAEAASADHRAARITLLTLNPTAARVTVEGRLYVLMPDHAWQIVWQHQVTEDASQPRPEAEQRIAADPQVAEGLKLLEQLGLQGNGDAVTIAIRHGAATMAAQTAADTAFSNWLLNNARKLEVPLQSTGF